jgi:hypothetical protein
MMRRLIGVLIMAIEGQQFSILGVRQPNPQTHPTERLSMDYISIPVYEHDLNQGNTLCQVSRLVGPTFDDIVLRSLSQ